MTPDCVRSHALVLDLVMQEASANGTALMRWAQDVGAWRLSGAFKAQRRSFPRFDLHFVTVEQRSRPSKPFQTA